MTEPFLADSAVRLRRSVCHLAAVSIQIDQIPQATQVIDRCVRALLIGDPRLPGFVRRALRGGLRPEQAAALIRSTWADTISQPVQREVA